MFSSISMSLDKVFAKVFWIPGCIQMILHLVLPLAPKLSPEAPTTCGMLVVSKSFNFSFFIHFPRHYTFHGTCVKECVNFYI